MNFATWSIRNPIAVIVLFALLAMSGLWSFGRLPIQDMPDIEQPTVNLELSQPGVTPSQLETEVARPVENAIASLDRLAHITTTITDGRVAIQVGFDLSKPLSEALSEVKEAVDGVRPTLPEDLQEPSVSAVKVGGDPILVYAVKSSQMDEEALSWFLDDVVARKISKVPGVGRFQRVGGVDREITVEIASEAAMAIGVTPLVVSRALESMQKQLSGGRGKFGERDQSVRVSALVPDAESLEGIAIALPNGYAKLGEIAKVQDSIQERAEVALLDGQTAVGFKVFPAKGADVTKVASEVEAGLDTVIAATPALRVELLSSTVDQTLKQYNGSMHMLFEGGALAMVVVWLFLRDWRATAVAAVALPLSILPVFVGMHFLGFSLNTLTLLALAVTIGVLVDDVIVEIENIKRHAGADKPMMQATADAVVEIAVVVLATTLCIVGAFLPTTIMPGVPGLLFRQFGWTAIIAALCSLLVARVFTPMMAAWLLKPDTKRARDDGRLMRLYLAAVDWCLAHRLVTVLAAGLFFAASVLFLPLIPNGLIPADDLGYTTINVEMAPGTTLDATREKAEEIRRAVMPVQGVEHVFAIVGSGGDGQGSDGNKAELLVTLASEVTHPGQAAFEHLVLAALVDVPGARFSVGSGGLGERAELLLASDDADALRKSARAIEREMRGLAGLSNVKSSASLDRAEIVIRPDTVKAAERGVATEDIGDSVRVATSGDFDSQIGRLNFDNRQVFLRVRLAEPARSDPQALGNIRIPGTTGLVPLASIADISIESGPTQIDRFDRARFVAIGGDLGSSSFGTAMAQIMSLPSVKSLPSNVSVIEAGDIEVGNDLQSGFVMAMAAGIFCVYGVLVVLFRDFFQPVTILSAIPFSLGGALVLLLVSGSQLDVLSLIGMITLIGVVTKNSILLVDYAIVGMRNGNLSVRDALIDACDKRARPIVMTTVAMIAGMAPVAVGFGLDASSRQPMALAVIGGLLTSTALSLLVVPVVFSCVSSARMRLGAFLSSSSLGMGSQERAVSIERANPQTET